MSKKDWTQNEIPDQTGRVAIVTGSNTGIGYYTAQYLAEKGAKVVMACRSAEKAEAARDRLLKAAPGATVELIPLDLSKQSSVKNFVDTYLSSHNTLDLLINNAGVMMCPFERTEDGFELQFGTNHLGHFALTGLLLPTILKTPGSRIVTVSSSMSRYGTIWFEDINYNTREYDKVEAYGQSKLANLLYGRELNRRLEEVGHKTLSMVAHPGWTETDLQRHMSLFRFMNTFFAMPTWKGALPTLRAAVDPEVRGGDFYAPHGFMGMRGFPVVEDPLKQRNADAVNWEDAKRLWVASEELTGIRYEL